MASVDSLYEQDDWDDSVLVNAWDDALQEYKRHRSLHAGGETFEDALAQEALRELALELGEYSDYKSTDEENEDGEGDEDEDEDEDEEMDDNDWYDEHDGEEQSQSENVNGIAADPTEKNVASQGSTEQAQQGAAETEFGTVAAGINGAPHAVLADGHDDNVPNMAMSWYWAGYYKGLYEGQAYGKCRHGAAQDA
ncbi:hypothetical protein BDY21DRAFT_85064 [Lineolata rhizophorae]|uniref:Survival Motor Neuron Gemin2-binding domain-containing protein n=1 Tax=Lineolata rhizophorae TaxID=578093 RepID=A0A6A6PBM3_9PEZI|nr:hypothetical protein BDY21DRAFT_85064 [Lineolata rhizophorae]